MLAYFAILGTALAAFFGAPIWTTLIGASVLVAMSVTEQRKLATRFANIGASHVLAMAAWQSAGHALIASGAAYALGQVAAITC